MLLNAALVGGLSHRGPAPVTGTPIAYLTQTNSDGDIVGTSGTDFVRGGTGFQGMYTGGGGPSYFVFSKGDGPDWIVDFRPGTDKLVLVNPGQITTGAHTDPGSGVTGTMVYYNSGVNNEDRVFLENVYNPTVSQITQSVTRVPVYQEEVTNPGSVTVPPPTTAKSIRLDPANPGDLGTAPKSWSTVAVVTGLDRIKYAVFHKDTAGAYTSNDTWREVAVPADGRVAITVTLGRARELLAVQSLDDLTKAESGLVSFSTVAQPAPSNDHDFAAAWLSDLTMGANIERNKLLYEGRITDAFLRDLRTKGPTHLRLFAGSGGNFGPLISQNDFRNWHLEGLRRVVAAGFKGHLDVLDVVYPNHMDEAHYAYVEECAKSIAAYGFDPTKVIFGVANEWGNAKNAEFEAIRNRALPLMRKHLPGFILVDSAGTWGDPWELAYGDFKPLGDRRMIHQWHQYHWEADKLSAAQGLQKDISDWCAKTGRLAYCGEWGLGPPDGARAQEYGTIPAVMDAGFRGMGQQRVAMWVITDGSHWRLNKSGTDPYLRDEIVAKFKEADAHIRAQAYFGSTGASTPAPAAASIDSITPQNPGTLNETTANAGVKVRTVVKTTGISRIKHVVVRGDAGNTWRTEAEVDTGGEVAIEPTYVDSGDFLKVLNAANLNVYKDGGAATVNKASGSAAPAASGGPATSIDLLLDGQSNAYLANEFGADRMLADMLAKLCGVPVNLISRKGQGTGDNTLHSSTSTAWVDPYDNSFGWWLSPPNSRYDTVENRSAINYGTDPKTWAAAAPLTETLAAVGRFRSTDANSVFVDCRLHWEYDLVMYGDAQPFYRAMAWEVRERIRTAAGKAAGRHFVAYAHCPYVGKTLRAIEAVGDAWARDEAERGVIVAGNMMDATSADGGSHWEAAGPQRSLLRAAMAIAHRLWNAGLLPAAAKDLSDAPSRGPSLGTPVKVSGTQLRVPVLHDKGTAIQAQNASAGVDWSAFHCSSDGGSSDASGGSFTASEITLNFPQAIGANPRLWYCAWPSHRGDRLLVDNWHTARPSKYADVPHIASLVFPLRRTLRGIPF